MRLSGVACSATRIFCPSLPLEFVALVWILFCMKNTRPHPIPLGLVLGSLRSALVALAAATPLLASAQAPQTATPVPQWRSDVAALMGQVAQHKAEEAEGVRHSKWSDTGTFVRAADGDTLAVKTRQHGLVTVRVSGVDAPERDMRHAQESTKFLLTFARNAELSLRCLTIDRFGRHVCEVRKGDKDLGAGLIAAGLAWHFKRYAHEQSPANRVLYARLETEAKDKRLGLWADLDAMRPELCRQFKREGLGCQ